MKRILTLIGLLTGLIVQAQDLQNPPFETSAPIPVEVMVGHNWIMFQNIVYKDFGPGNKVNFFNLINYEVEYDSEAPASYIVQSIFSYKLTDGLALGAGANLKAFGGFEPIIAGQYTMFNRSIGLVVQPTFAFGENRVAELFALFEWFPEVGKSWQPYFSIQGASAVATKIDEHEFSYLNARLGVQHKSIRIGPALNSRFIAKDFHPEWNLGAFAAILIH